MPNSYAMDIDYTCIFCEEDITVHPWLIIDFTEQPDLLGPVKQGTIHDLTCPTCGEMIPMEPPLLLYFPGDEPRFLFTTRQSDGTGFPGEMIREMFDGLVESSGDQELAESYHDHRAWVLKEDLPERLKEYPETPLRDFDWSEFDELKQLEMLMPEDYFQMVMTDYFGTPDWNKKSLIVDRAPLLLTPAIEPWLEGQVKAFTELGQDDNVQVVQDHLGILTRAREIGYYQAVLEFQEERSSSEK